jgi:hypothetical protein
MRNLTLGLSIDGENVVGTGTVKPRRPYLFIKLPLYSGDEFWPVLSMGFDEQGLGSYNDDTDEYEVNPMGFFIVATKLGLTTGLDVSAGLNANYSLIETEEKRILGFCNANYTIGPEFVVHGEVKEIAEWDSTVNLGAKYLLTPELPERIIRVTYTKVWGDF